MLGIAQSLEWTFWVAPDKVNRIVAMEAWWRQRGRISRSERQELESYTRAG